MKILFYVVIGRESDDLITQKDIVNQFLNEIIYNKRDYKSYPVIRLKNYHDVSKKIINIFSILNESIMNYINIYLSTYDLKSSNTTTSTDSFTKKYENPAYVIINKCITEGFYLDKSLIF